MELSGKGVLVTGGGSGIGLAIGEGLAREGCRVAISGRDEAKLQAAAAAFDGPEAILTHPCDVANREQVNQLVDWASEKLGQIDILVNSAGINIPTRQFDKLDPSEWDRIMGINVTGAFNCMHAVVPGMRKLGGGLIINISSIAGKRAMKLGGAGYCASKFAMTALGTTVGLEERENGIHVTNVYPGEVNTPILNDRPTPVPAEKLARMLMPEDIAEVVVTIAKLPARALVPELVITPLYQEYA